MLRRGIICATLLIPLLAAQDLTPSDPAPARSATPASAPSADYRLGSGDLIEIGVFGVEELHRVVRISMAGAITLPLVGKLTAAGLTAQELEARITAILSEQKFVRDPQVGVFIKEYRSQPVYVMGAVSHPGQYMVTTQLRLLDALTMAGGLDSTKSEDYLLIRRRSSSATDETPAQETIAEGQPGVIRIDLTALLEKGDVSLNVLLQGGDVIQVPEKQEKLFYVVGDVEKPGAFPFVGQRQVSVLGAVSFAGGLGRTAKPEKAKVLRPAENEAKRMEIAVNIKNILLGKDEDIALRPDDVLVVPTSSRKVFATTILPAAVGASVAAIIYAAVR